MRLHADREAMDLALELSSRHPDDVVVWRALVSASQRRSQFGEALRACENVLRLEPKDGDVK